MKRQRSIFRKTLQIYKKWNIYWRNWNFVWKDFREYFWWFNLKM